MASNKMARGTLERFHGPRFALFVHDNDAEREWADDHSWNYWWTVPSFMSCVNWFSPDT
jgi:hypothetical protein